MSDSPDDVELSRLQRAAEFMHGVRLTQAGISRKFIGGNHLSPEQTQSITQAVSSSALVAAVKESAQVDLPLNNMAERFEEMARRQGVTVDTELRSAVVKLLAAELWVNSKALDRLCRREREKRRRAGLKRVCRSKDDAIREQKKPPHRKARGVLK